MSDTDLTVETGRQWEADYNAAHSSGASAWDGEHYDAAQGREDELAGGQESDELDESWQRVDLGPALRGEVTKPAPTILVRDDGAALYTPACVNWLHGDSGEGKSMVAAIAVAQVLAGGRHALWVDFEDPDPTTLVERLRDTLDVSAEAIATFLHYYGPVEPIGAPAVEHLERDAAEHDAPIIVLDSFGEAAGLEGLDENKDVDVAPWVRRVARRLADAGPAVLVLDHSTKAGDNPLYPSGSKRKRAAITGQGYLLEAPIPLNRERGGRLTLKCAKDRHGRYRRGAVVATIELNPYSDGVVVHVRAPAESDQRAADEPAVVLDLMERKAVEALEQEGEPVSQRRLLELMNVKASASKKRAGMEQGVSRGTLRERSGPNRSRLYALPRWDEGADS
jgi:hypothetical protein